MERATAKAVVRSIIVPGLGQWTNGEALKGTLMFAGTVGLWFLWLGWVVWLWSIIDAYLVARSRTGERIYSFSETYERFRF